MLTTLTAAMLPLLVLLTTANARSLSSSGQDPTSPLSSSGQDPTSPQTSPGEDVMSPLPSRETGGSHLLFYLTVEKELLPQTKELAARALHILQIQCSEFYNKTSECLLETDRLPAIPALGDLPSEGALHREGSKVFSKHLLKDVYRTLVKLQVLLEEENEGIEPLTQLILHMERTRQQLRDQMDLFYRARLRSRDSYTTLTKSKKRYLRRSRRGDDDCRPGDDKDVDEDEECLTEDDYRLRLLYTAYRQLMRVHHVLGYTVRLSWLQLEEDRWP